MTSLLHRTARRRRYLLCPPTHFAVRYAINPWMDPGQPVDRAAADRQWRRLCAVLRSLGHEVLTLDPLPGLPDMVFTANGATVVGGRVLVARFKHAERAGEATAHRRWFDRAGFRPVHTATRVNEGEGDLLVAGRRILAGWGFRTTAPAHREAQHLLGLPVVTLRLVDPRFYHLDTALTVLSDDQIMYWPPAFAPTSRRLLASLYPDAIRAGETDAAVFGLNAVSDGRHVVLPRAATGLAAQLHTHGYRPVPVEMPELLKAGGGPKCCTLELRDA
ncbi:dimethylargininase [Kitasatospora sp. NPDC051914]|uniref:dimethylargininase n=1 Tax=Kitasatospora sp. NPDC051914 TaxID=3154945 RepID=UPI00343022FF